MSFLDNVFGKTDHMSQYMLRVRNGHPKINEILGSVLEIWYYNTPRYMTVRGKHLQTKGS